VFKVELPAMVSVSTSLNGRFDEVNKYEIDEVFTQIVVKYKRKRNYADALRKWTQSIIQKTIRLLNGNTPKSRFHKEPVQILVEGFFFSSCGKTVISFRERFFQ
jgi:hypothetical protein